MPVLWDAAARAGVPPALAEPLLACYGGRRRVRADGLALTRLSGRYVGWRAVARRRAQRLPADPGLEEAAPAPAADAAVVVADTGGSVFDGAGPLLARAGWVALLVDQHRGTTFVHSGAPGLAFGGALGRGHDVAGGTESGCVAPDGRLSAVL